MTEVRSTAEALRAISDELRAIERARFRDGEPLPPTFFGSRPWTIAASSFALGFAVTRFVRASIASTKRTPRAARHVRPARSVGRRSHLRVRE